MKSTNSDLFPKLNVLLKMKTVYIKVLNESVYNIIEPKILYNDSSACIADVM